MAKIVFAKLVINPKEDVGLAIVELLLEYRFPTTHYYSLFFTLFVVRL